ncbi:protein of unknown function [Micropruina glycogenica]|uniref:Uncharacterized protein n=1 Tax=Micropruina glycogenica TaxID=75385 RepID=A0A2N9JDM5_9ACTN|nr:protein of unknown function [Micropruina glycogenica]
MADGAGLARRCPGRGIIGLQRPSHPGGAAVRTFADRRRRTARQPGGAPRRRGGVRGAHLRSRVVDRDQPHHRTLGRPAGRPAHRTACRPRPAVHQDQRHGGRLPGRPGDSRRQPGGRLSARLDAAVGSHLGVGDVTLTPLRHPNTRSDGTPPHRRPCRCKGRALLGTLVYGAVDAITVLLDGGSGAAALSVLLYGVASGLASVVVWAAGSPRRGGVGASQGRGGLMACRRRTECSGGRRGCGGHRPDHDGMPAAGRPGRSDSGADRVRRHRADGGRPGSRRRARVAGSVAGRSPARAHRRRGGRRPG